MWSALFGELGVGRACPAADIWLKEPSKIYIPKPFFFSKAWQITAILGRAGAVLSLRSPMNTPSSCRALALWAGQGRAAPLQLRLTKGLCSRESQGEKPALCGIAGETGATNLSTSSDHAWIPAIFPQHSTNPAAGKHLCRRRSPQGSFYALACADIQQNRSFCQQDNPAIAALYTLPDFAGNVRSVCICLWKENKHFKGKRKKNSKPGKCSLCQHDNINSACCFTPQ